MKNYTELKSMFDNNVRNDNASIL